MTKKLSVLYMTCLSQEEARRIAADLIEKKLIGCANIVDGALSIYPWKGKIEESREAILILKTLESKVEDLFTRLKQIHSYEIPCCIQLDTLKVNPEFEGWINELLTPALPEEEADFDRPPWD